MLVSGRADALRLLLLLVILTLAAHLLPQSLLVLLLVVHMLGGGRLHEGINVNAWLEKGTTLYLLLSPALGPAVLTMLPENINYASLKSSSYSTRIMKN